MSDFTPQGLSLLTCALEGVGMVTSFIKEAVVRVQRDKVCKVLNLQRLCVCAPVCVCACTPGIPGLVTRDLCVAKAVCVHTCV